MTTRGNARLGGLSRVSRGHSPRSRPEGLRRGDHAPRQEQRRSGQRRSSEVRVSAFLQTVVSAFFPAQPGFPRASRAFEASHGERTAHQARIRRWISPHHLGSPPSSRHRSLTRAVYPAHSQVRRHIRSGAVHRCTASRCAPWKPRRRVRGQPVRRRGLIRRRYARDAAVHRLPVRPHSDPPFLPTLLARKCASPSISNRPFTRLDRSRPRSRADRTEPASSPP